MLLQIHLEDKGKEDFEELFKNSGLKSRAEYIRFLINQETKDSGKCCETKEMDI